MTCKGCLVGVLVLFAASVLAAILMVVNLGRFLDVSRNPGKADAIVVLGGEGARYMRTRHAIDLFDAGLAPKVVFSGGSLLNAGIACSSTEMSAGAAEKLGLPSAAIVLSPEAQSTFDEGGNLRTLAKELGWHSLIVVTDRFHTVSRNANPAALFCLV